MDTLAWYFLGPGQHRAGAARHPAVARGRGAGGAGRADRGAHQARSGDQLRSAAGLVHRVRGGVAAAARRGARSAVAGVGERRVGGHAGGAARPGARLDELRCGDAPGRSGGRVGARRGRAGATAAGRGAGVAAGGGVRVAGHARCDGSGAHRGVDRPRPGCGVDGDGGSAQLRLGGARGGPRRLAAPLVEPGRPRASRFGVERRLWIISTSSAASVGGTGLWRSW